GLGAAWLAFRGKRRHAELDVVAAGNRTGGRENLADADRHRDGTATAGRRREHGGVGTHADARIRQDALDRFQQRRRWRPRVDLLVFHRIEALARTNFEPWTVHVHHDLVELLRIRGDIAEHVVVAGRREDAVHRRFSRGAIADVANG